MDFLLVSGVFLAFVLGLTLVVVGVMGEDPHPRGEHRVLGIGDPVIHHPPVRHRGAMVFAGIGTTVAAAVVAIVFVA